MARLDYAQVVHNVLTRYLDYIGSPNMPHLEIATLFDDKSKTYAILDIGWQAKERIEAIVVLIRLKDGKIWVETDHTDYGFVDELLQAGVPQEDLVLAFHHPTLRPYVELAAV